LNKKGWLLARSDIKRLAFEIFFRNIADFLFYRKKSQKSIFFCENVPKSHLFCIQKFGDFDQKNFELLVISNKKCWILTLDWKKCITHNWIMFFIFSVIRLFDSGCRLNRICFRLAVGLFFKPDLVKISKEKYFHTMSVLLFYY